MIIVIFEMFYKLLTFKLFNFLRQTSGSNVNPIFGLSSSKKSAVDGDLVNFQVSINMLQ